MKFIKNLSSVEVSLVCGLMKNQTKPIHFMCAIAWRYIESECFVFNDWILSAAHDCEKCFGSEIMWMLTGAMMYV